MSTDLRRTAWRIGLQTAGLLIACLLVVSTVVYVAVVRSQEEHLSQTLTDAVAAAAPGDQDRDPDGDDRRFRLRLQGGTFTAVRAAAAGAARRGGDGAGTQLGGRGPATGGPVHRTVRGPHRAAR